VTTVFTNYYDSHVHSVNSSDAVDSVEAICAHAIRIGLKGIAFTDHCDIDAGDERCERVRRGIVSDVIEARDLYGNDLRVSAGIELGEAHHNPGLARRISGDASVDFVIGSLHRMRGEEDFYHIDYENTDIDALMRRYYEELYELVENGCFDVVGHINYQPRYMSERAKRSLDLPRYYSDLFEILKSVARQGKGIEINTSGLWRNQGDTIPSSDVLKLFFKAGGEIVTIGSDSHNLRSVGLEIFSAMEKLKLTGLSRFAFFSGRVPEIIDIE
jgi:histidinol-phosphatase (PHP family)